MHCPSCVALAAVILRVAPPEIPMSHCNRKQGNWRRRCEQKICVAFLCLLLNFWMRVYQNASVGINLVLNVSMYCLISCLTYRLNVVLITTKEKWRLFKRTRVYEVVLEFNCVTVRLSVSDCTPRCLLFLFSLTIPLITNRVLHSPRPNKIPFRPLWRRYDARSCNWNCPPHWSHGLGVCRPRNLPISNNSSSSSIITIINQSHRCRRLHKQQHRQRSTPTI